MKKIFRFFVITIIFIFAVIPKANALTYTSQTYDSTYGHIVYSLTPEEDKSIRFEIDKSYMQAYNYGFLSIDFLKDNIVLNTYYFSNTEDYLLFLPRENANKMIVHVYKIFGTMGMGDLESIKANGYDVDVPILFDYSVMSQTPSYYYDLGYDNGFNDGWRDSLLNTWDYGVLNTINDDLTRFSHEFLLSDYEDSFDYDAGFSDGYSYGYNLETDFSLFTQTLTFMGGIFAIEIWPNVSIGLLASIPIGLALFKWFLGLFGKGGGGSK